MDNFTETIFKKTKAKKNLKSHNKKFKVSCPNYPVANFDEDMTVS